MSTIDVHSHYLPPSAVGRDRDDDRPQASRPGISHGRLEQIVVFVGA